MSQSFNSEIKFVEQFYAKSVSPIVRRTNNYLQSSFESNNEKAKKSISELLEDTHKEYQKTRNSFYETSINSLSRTP